MTDMKLFGQREVTHETRQKNVKSYVLILKNVET